MISQQLTIAILFVLCSAVLTQAPAASPNGNHFLVEAKVAIDGKNYNPTNISLTIGSQLPLPEYSFNLSSTNFNKNVTIPLRLFAWYNGQWTLSRQSITMKITDKRNVYRKESHLLAQILKFNNRRYEAKMVDQKESTILNFSQVIVSYDPESSLLVSRMEDPAIFNKQENYLPLIDLQGEMKSKPIKVAISFQTLTRTDSFITIKNHIVSLNELASKVRERIPMISRPLQAQVIEPLQIYRSIFYNFDKIRLANKQYNERAALMRNKNYDGLLLPRLHLVPFPLPAIIHKYVESKNISLADAFIPTYYYILQQGFILDSINQLQNYLRSTVSEKERYQLSFFQLWAEADVMVTIGVAILWVFSDIISYSFISVFPGLSCSFGYFFVAWLVTQQIPLSIRIESALNPYWGVGYFFLSLILIKLLVTPLQRKFKKASHHYSYFDRIVTEYAFNLIILGVIVNGILHTLVVGDLKSIEIIFWGLGQFQMLLNEYYYFLVMIPPLLLSFKLKSTSHIGWVRIILLLIVGLKDNYWLLIDNSHWGLIALRLKEEILFILLVLLKIVYGNKRIEIIHEPIIYQKRVSKQPQQPTAKASPNEEAETLKKQQQKQQNESDDSQRQLVETPAYELASMFKKD